MPGQDLLPALGGALVGGVVCGERLGDTAMKSGDFVSHPCPYGGHGGRALILSEAIPIDLASFHYAHPRSSRQRGPALTSTAHVRQRYAHRRRPASAAD